MESLKLTNNLRLTPQTLNVVFALRYVSYREKRFIAANEEQLFYDKYDAMPNCLSFAIYDDSKVAGSAPL